MRNKEEGAGQGAMEGEGAREETQAELEDTMAPAFAVGEFAAEVFVTNDLGAQATDPGRRQGQDEPQAIGMLGGADLGALPLPVARFQVTKGGLFPHAQPIPSGTSVGPVGQQQPRLFIAALPAPHGPTGAPATFLKRLDGPRPAGSRPGHERAELDILAVDLEVDRALDADQEVPAQGFNGGQQARATTDPAIGLDQDWTGRRYTGGNLLQQGGNQGDLAHRPGVVAITPPRKRQRAPAVRQTDDHDLEMGLQAGFVDHQHEGRRGPEAAQNSGGQPLSPDLPIEPRVGDKALKPALDGIRFAQRGQRFGDPPLRTAARHRYPPS